MKTTENTQTTFQPERFQSKWWAWNTHVHTVFPSKFGKAKQIACTRIEIDTPDQDFLELDVLDLKNDKPVVALFHGLEGSSRRIYIRNLMHELQHRGLSSVALNFRGCGDKLNNQPRFYHSGETKDYETLFSWMKNEFPQRPLFAVGFSLGGNALIKSLGELGSNHPVERAAAVSPPYDLRAGSVNLQKGFNRVYQRYFMVPLTKKLDLKRRKFPDLPVFTGKTLYDFDDQVTAVIYGFESADHYYETCSSKHFLKDVRKPILIIHSMAETLCPLEYAPFDDIENNKDIQTIFTDEGGHVGFLSTPSGWLNRTVADWLTLPNDSYL